MKVLVVGNNAYFPECNYIQYRRNKTGFSTAITELCNTYDCNNCSIFLLSFLFNNKNICNTINKSNNLTLVEYNFYKIFKYLTVTSFLKITFFFLIYTYYFKTPKFITTLFQSPKLSIKAFFKCFLQFISIPYFKNIIQILSPDIVHLHGLTLDYIPIIEVCNDLQIPYLVTAHGSNTKNIYNKGIIDYGITERHLSEWLNKNNIIITVVSTGVLKHFQNEYRLANKDRVILVIEGSKFSNNQNIIELNQSSKDRIKQKYQISKERIVLSTFSNVSKRKNQLFVVEAIKKLQPNYLYKIVYLIVGDDNKQINLKKIIIDNNLDDFVKILGFQDKNSLIELFSITDLMIMPSLEEGYGLPIAEAYSFGVPVLMFSDVDAVEDLYDKDSMILVHNRSISSFNEKLIEAINTSFNKIKIFEFSQKFSIKRSTENYNYLYHKILNNNIEYQKNFLNSFLLYIKAVRKRSKK